MKKVNLFVLLSLLSLSISSCNNQYETLKDIEEEKDQDEILYEIDQINGFEKQASCNERGGNDFTPCK